MVEPGGRARRQAGQPWLPDSYEEPVFTHSPRGFGEWVERMLLQLAIVGLVALVVVQTLLVIPEIRRIATVLDSLEGPPARVLLQPPSVAVTAPSPTGRITIALINQPEAAAEIWVDNTPAGTLLLGSLTINVRPGQRLTARSGAAEAALVLRAIRVAGLVEPKLGTEWMAMPGEILDMGILR